MTPSKQGTKDEIAAYFDQHGTVLVEVAFPKMGTSPDWYLFECPEQLADLLATLADNVVVRLVPVDSITSVKGERRFTIKR
jgi:hypothetical protein